MPPYAVVVGVPMEIIKFRFDEEVISKLLKIKWWNFEYEDLIKVEKNFFDIKSFIHDYDSKHTNNA